MKILVVDDDVDIQRLYKEDFEMEGWEVSIASNGKEAKELFKNEVPDLITLDILLPDIDGIKILRWMKERRPAVPIIMSSAYDYRDDYAAWDSEAYIVKSSNTEELRSMMRRLLVQSV